nr:IS982 family transposase [Pontibacter sp. 172403-2]
MDTAKVVEVFCFLDDFCKEVAAYFATHPLPAALHPRSCAGRKPSLSESEVLTILVLYHLSGFKCFEYFYQRLILRELHSYFPGAVSYTQFLSLARQACFHALLLAQYRCSLSARTGHYYIDSKKLPVCDNGRIHQHHVFDGIAQRGKSSTGWFFGLKLHLVTNEHKQLVWFLVTPANIADNNKQVLSYMLSGLKGKCYGDKGYLTAMLEELLEKELHLVSKIRKNMKNILLSLHDKLNLMKRGTIEAVNDILMSVCDINHTRHRNPLNALVHILSGLTAYTFLESNNSKFKPARINA